MLSRFLITNNTDQGHDAETWAMAAAETVADHSGLEGGKAIEAMKLQLNFSQVLQSHFEKLQQEERSKLAADGKHVLSDFADHLVVDVKSIVEELVKVAKGTLWEAHYLSPDVQTMIFNELVRLFFSAMHVDRLNHVERNPTCEHGAAYKARYHGGAN